MVEEGGGVLSASYLDVRTARNSRKFFFHAFRYPIAILFWLLAMANHWVGRVYFATRSIRIRIIMPHLWLESIKKSSTLAISTLGEGRDHTCVVSDVPSRLELSSFIDSSPAPGLIGNPYFQLSLTIFLNFLNLLSLPANSLPRFTVCYSHSLRLLAGFKGTIR